MRTQASSRPVGRGMRAVTLVLALLAVGLAGAAGELSEDARARLARVGTWDGVTETAALAGPYEDPFQAEIPFGQHSFYLTPWRAYMDTWPARRWSDGLGFALHADAQKTEAAIAEIMASAGFRVARVEVGWGSMDFDDPTRLRPHEEAALVAKLQALKRHGLRPLILLNANHGGPCPAQYWDTDVVEDAPEGSRTVRLAEVARVVVGYTGVNGDKAAESIITAVDPDTGVCTLSRPLRRAVAKGNRIGLATLKFRPFSSPTFADGTPNPACQETLDGWMAYVGYLCAVAKRALATEDNPDDAGFDFEMWNEYTFGSDFLNIRYYYEPPLAFADELVFAKDGWEIKGVEVILPMLVEYVNDPANGLPGVGVINGFANQRPWDNSAEMWPGQRGYSRHYYTGLDMRVRTGDETTDPDRSQHIGPLTALGTVSGVRNNKDWHTVDAGTYFIPAHRPNFAEMWYCAYQTEFLVRDLQPFPSPFEPHFRYGQNGTGRPAEVWMTETNTWRQPWMRDRIRQAGVADDDPRVRALSHAIGAKALLRNCVFHGHKGLTTITLHSVPNHDEDLDFALLPASFYKQLADDGYELTDAVAAAVGPQIQSIARVTRLLADAEPVEVTRPLTVERLVEHRPRLVWQGDGTPENPDRFHRDDFAVLPFQTGPDRYAIAFYVVTRDMVHEWAPEKDLLDPARYAMPPQDFDLTLGNLCGEGATLAVFDPLTGETTPYEALAADGTTLTVRLATVDYPRFLVVREPRSGPEIVEPTLKREADADGRAVLRFGIGRNRPASVTWGPLPGRTADGIRELAGDNPAAEPARHEFVFDDLPENHGVRITVEENGLTTSWPRWDYDTAGVAVFPQRKDGGPAPRPLRLPALAADRTLPARFSAPDADALDLGDAFEVRLDGRAGNPLDALPLVSVTDWRESRRIEWNGYPAWQIDIAQDAIAHPDAVLTRQRYYIAPLADGGYAALSILGTPDEFEQRRDDIQDLMRGVLFEE